MAYTQSNEIKTRISLKYDSFSNWKTINPTLLAGEIAIAYLGPTHTPTTPDNGTHPVMFKVGPGSFNSLPWASALAADVYAWAKAEEVALDKTNEKLLFKDANGNSIKEVDLSHFASDDELQALAAELGGRIDVVDTDTKYVFSIVDNNLQIKVTDKAGTQIDELQMPLVTDAELATMLNGYVTKVEYNADKEALEADIAEVDAKFSKYATIDAMNAEFANYTKTDDLDSKMAALTYIKSGAVDTKISTELESYYDKGEIDGKVSTINGAIDGINANFSNYDTKSEVNTKISTALESYYDKGKVDELIGDLATAMNFKGVVTSLPDAGEQHGDVVVLKTTTADGESRTEEYVWNKPEGSLTGEWVKLGDESLLGQVAKELDTVVDELDTAKAKIANVIGDYEGTLAALDQRVVNNKTAIEVIYKKDGSAESGRLVEAEGDIADNKAAIEVIYKVEGSKKTGVLVDEIARVEGLIDDAEAALANMTVSQDGTGGDYVNAISRDADGNIKYTKASLPTLAAANIGAGTTVDVSNANTVSVVAQVLDNGTSGHAVKLKTDVATVATMKGAEKAAADAVTNFAANMVETGTGKFVTGMTKSGNNISFTKGDVNVSDLKQTANTYVWFNCGSASEVM